MEAFNEIIQALLKEFSDLSVDINIKETIYDDVDQPLIEINEETGEDIITGFVKLWDFDLTFNREFTVKYNIPKYLNQKAFNDYRKFIKEKELNTYQELNDFLISEKSMFEIRNHLNSVKLRLKELLKGYYYVTEEIRSPFYKLLDNQTIIRTISEGKLISNLSEKELVNVFLIVQRKTIKSLLKFIKGKLTIVSEKENSAKPNQNDDVNSSIKSDIKENKQDGIKEKKRSFPTKSFELNPKLQDPHVKLIEFKNNLEKLGFIEPIHFQKFVRVFTNHDVIQPIIWKRKPNELYHLIKWLYKKRIIKQFKNYWQITCKCFVLKRNDKKIILTPEYMARNKSPRNTIIKRDLNALFVFWD
ncbi:MAG TPA: hypothetical protein VIK14_12025 [Ignavibacteria bacterium]